MVKPILTAFQPGAGAGSAWELARAQLVRPRNPQPSLEELREELALRELIARYAYTWDQGDIDGVMEFFTEDCAIDNRLGTVDGSDAIRANYERMLRDTPRRQHLFCNVVVRLSEDLREAWMSAYHYAVLELAESVCRTVSGLIIDNLVKQGNDWKIRGRSVSIDTMADAVVAGGGAEVVDAKWSGRRSRKR